MKRKVFIFKHIKSFLIRFWPMVIWVSITLIIFWKTFTSFKTKPEYYYLRKMLGCWLCISRGTAPVLTMCSLLVLLPVCRSLHTVFHSYLAKISTNLLAGWLSMVKIMHMVCASTLIIFSLIHSGAHVMNAVYFSKHFTPVFPEINLARYKGENPVFLICTWTGISGLSMLILLLLMAFTSTTKFRTKHFNAFYITHHLFVIYLLLFMIHPFSGILKQQYNLKQHIPGCVLRKNLTVSEESEIYENDVKSLSGYCEEPPLFKCVPTKSWVWILIALIIYLMELIHRRYHGKTMEAIQACQISKKALYLKLKCQKNFKVDPGQYVLVQFDEISNIEWHPFTVTQCPTDEHQNFDLLINTRGDWTKKLHEFVQQPFAFNECSTYITRLYHKPLKFHIDGPFVSPMQSIKCSRYAICVAAGVGITSYIATLRYMLLDKCPNLKRLQLLWLTRDPKQLLWYSKLLCDLQSKFWDENLPDKFHVQLFLTKEQKKRDVLNLFNNNMLQNRVKIGRPNWKEEFRIWSFIYGRTKVAIYCCGPKTLTQELRKRCVTSNKNGTCFKFIHEGF